MTRLQQQGKPCVSRQDLLKIHEDTCRSALNTMKKKNHDYASSEDPFQNFNGSQVYGIHRVVGLLLRVGDKLQRINTFVNKGTLLVENEGVYDAIEDVINYMVLAKGMIIEESLANSPSNKEVSPENEKRKEEDSVEHSRVSDVQKNLFPPSGD